MRCGNDAPPSPPKENPMICQWHFKMPHAYADLTAPQPAKSKSHLPATDGNNARTTSGFQKGHGQRASRRAARSYLVKNKTGHYMLNSESRVVLVHFESI